MSSQDVYDLLRDVGYNADLRPARWVMNLEWYKAVRRAFPAVPGLGDEELQARHQPGEQVTRLAYEVRRVGQRLTRPSISERMWNSA